MLDAARTAPGPGSVATTYVASTGKKVDREGFSVVTISWLPQRRYEQIA
jgi:hypothetical protein